MPDENKFRKLREIGYRIPVTCALCIHFETPIGPVVGRWGTCRKHRYRHKKHDSPDEGRGVSCIAGGSCPDAELDESKVVLLGAHREFLDGGASSDEGG